MGVSIRGIPRNVSLFSVYSEGHFLGGHILHIAASVRGISLKRFVVNLLY